MRLFPVSSWCALGVLMTPAAFVSGGFVAMDDPAVQIVGRATDASGAVVLEYPGIEVRLRFSGSGIAVRGESLSGENWFNSAIDGIPQPVVAVGDSAFDVVLASGLDPAAVHELRLLRRNEHWQGTVRLDGFVITEGEARPADETRSRRLMAIGDSITCGHGVDLIPPDATPGNHTANAGGTYGWALAERFDAQLHLVAYGGKGLMRDWEGNEKTIRAPEFFERTSPEAPESRWDHDRYHPDAIIVALGTNDYSRGIIEPETYAAAYIAFVDRLRTVHPEAKILLMSSPMLSRGSGVDSRAGEHVLRAGLARVVVHFQQAGVGDVRAHFIGHYPGTEWDAHAIAPQHQAIADELEPVLAEWLDWR